MGGALRISATALESFRLYYQEQADFMDVDKLIADLSGAGEVTEAMTRGTAGHRLIELGPAARAALLVDGKYNVEVPGPLADRETIAKGGLTVADDRGRRCLPHWHVFDAASFERAVAGIPEGMTHEIKVTVPVTAYDGTLVTLVSKADALEGLTVHEFKFTSRWEPDKYHNSVQWRMYLRAFRAAACQYWAFVCGEMRDGAIEIREVHRPIEYPYATMDQDIQTLVDDLVKFIKVKGLERFFQPRAEQPPAPAPSDDEMTPADWLRLANECGGCEVPRPSWEDAAKACEMSGGKFRIGPARGPGNHWRRMEEVK